VFKEAAQGELSKTMSGKPIRITELDLERLKKLLQDAQYTDYRKSEYLKRLQMEIERAEVVKPQDIPDDVITMNSTVSLLDLDTGEEEIYTLVFPENADLKQGKISVFAPIGTAMLGYEVGDVFEWEVPAGKRNLRVMKILYQPEASGDYHL
jgi:regulator of nucleoside diphosphate kinase